MNQNQSKQEAIQEGWTEELFESLIESATALWDCLVIDHETKAFWKLPKAVRPEHAQQILEHLRPMSLTSVFTVRSDSVSDPMAVQLLSLGYEMLDGSELCEPVLDGLHDDADEPDDDQVDDRNDA